MNTDYIKQGDCIKIMPNIESVDLIIADPPYFKVVNETWDYQWRTEEDYIEWSRKWIEEAAKVLRIGGTMYLFGYFRILAKLIPILETNGFEVRQQIVINKGIRAVTGRATKKYKMFPNVTEHILLLVKDPKPFAKEFLKKQQKNIGISAKEINRRLGVKTNGGGMWSIYTGNNVCKQFPTKELWDKLQDILEFVEPYEKIAQTYHPILGLTDVWDDIDFYSEKRYHPTQKPQKLLERLLLASSNEGDKVLDPFAGAGSTGVACINTNRNFIGIELDENYFNTAKERIEKAKQSDV